MEKLLLSYSGSEIIFFSITLAFAIKGCVTFYDWARSRLKESYEKDLKAEIQEQEQNEKIDNTCNSFGNFDKRISELYDLVYMLIESDRANIRAYIVDRHHYFVYVQGWIDDYSLDSLEKRFAIYKQEKGNTYAEGLMKEIRQLPKQPPSLINKDNQPTL